ncbi:hypothetical protein HZA38_03810 [Candidatus Peregrinibacteria bacterium]|nr:hypothetical protein [Candidatus Peregrinibacteria bacterium]
MTIGTVTVAGTIFFHSYPKYTEAQKDKIEIQQIDAKIKEKKTGADDIKTELAEKEKKFNEDIKDLKPILERALPTSDPTDEIAEFLEDFALYTNSETHPMSMENIAFTEPKKEGGYFVVPFRMSIEADQENFSRFMKQVEISGSLKREDFYRQNSVPIMSIESINVNIPQEKDEDPALKKSESSGEKKIETFSFSVNLQAYYKPEAETVEGK